MEFSIPDLSIVPGHLMCLHYPHRDEDSRAGLEHWIGEMARRKSKIVLICRPAINRGGWRERIRPQTSIEWLARNGNMTSEEAAERIATMPHRVVRELSGNAGTPRALLGIAAVISHKPDLLIYSTDGVDQSGCEEIHQYVSAQCTETSALYINNCGPDDWEWCPPNAECIRPTRRP